MLRLPQGNRKQIRMNVEASLKVIANVVINILMGQYAKMRLCITIEVYTAMGLLTATRLLKQCGFT